MFNNPNRDKEFKKEKKVLEFIDKNRLISDGLVDKKFRHLCVNNYNYTTDFAVKELGLEDELINQLVEDYVIQIIKSKTAFLNYLDLLRQQESNGETLDYSSFRELAHKNLGVARNLRIEDAQKLLNELMTQDDLDYLNECLEILISCAVKLKPRLAYETMQINNSL